MSNPILSKQQKNVINSIIDWSNTVSKQYITLGGYAGTGKTTILGHISEILHKKNKNLKIAFCSYTGKASRVLERKLKENNSIYTSDYIGTIHRLIYRPVVDSKGNIIDWERIPNSEFRYALIIIDEASMVTSDIWEDLLSYDVPILAVGDHGQLPPVNSEFNLMDNPQLKLEEIYRQESSNPIIAISEMARKDGYIPFGQYGEDIAKLEKSDSNTGEILMDVFTSFDNNTMILCGYNRSRIDLNNKIRSLKFDSPLPQIGDRVICLKNNRDSNIYNGMTGSILYITKEKFKGLSYYESEIFLDYEDDPFQGMISIDQFNSPTLNDHRIQDMNYFDFGYALTVHKAQGSQAKKVVVFEERFPRTDDETFSRWLYTAVTRAEEKLYIIA